MKARRSRRSRGRGERRGGNSRRVEDERRTGMRIRRGGYGEEDTERKATDVCHGAGVEWRNKGFEGMHAGQMADASCKW